MRREPKSQRRLGLKKETLRTLNAAELQLAGGGEVVSGEGILAASLSGTRKCATSTACNHA